jgi:hypothetical protein
MSRRVPTVASSTATLDDFCEPDPVDEENTCPNGETWCNGPDGDDLPCFDCFDPEQDYNVGESK